MTKLWRLLPAIAWMGLIFYLSSIPELELQGEWSIYDFALRKLAHIGEYAVLFALLVWGLRPDSKQVVNYKLSFAIALLYAVSDEFHQSLVPSRDGKLADVLIDTLGIIIGMLAIRYFPNHGSLANLNQS